jgi:tyrosinase
VYFLLVLVSYPVLHRKSIHALEAHPESGELNNLRTAFKISMGISDNRGYGYIAGFHGVPSWYCWHHQTDRRTTISGPFFLPWHRAYLSYLELHLKQNSNDPTVTIPYWDWSSIKSRSEGVPRAYDEEKMPNGEENPLKTFHIQLPRLDRHTQRYPNPPSELPTDEQVQDIIHNDHNFDDFILDLQEIHDEVHGWFTRPGLPNGTFGDMSQVALSSYDPIFYAHHCMIDRIWYLWQLEHGSTTGFEQLLDVPLAPFNLTIKNVIDIRGLGYDYAGDLQEVSVSVGLGD